MGGLDTNYATRQTKSWDDFTDSSCLSAYTLALHEQLGACWRKPTHDLLKVKDHFFGNYTLYICVCLCPRCWRFALPQMCLSTAPTTGQGSWMLPQLTRGHVNRACPLLSLYFCFRCILLKSFLIRSFQLFTSAEEFVWLY